MGRGSTTVRRLTGGLVVLLVSGLLAVAAPGSAQAASASSTASCAGRKVRTLSFSAGSVLVYRDGGYVCAVTVQKHPGVKRLVSVSLQARGHVAVPKSRQHTQSSPSVRVYAGHRFIRVSGGVGGTKYTSPWFSC
ncbi:hypothetical protein [Streptomyces sp. NPDC050263]|uniref:hypothetical protein n=1 Tax=Streptomyces sp. NPDC050263 TaxID=3155037 RepID=UPI00342C0087